MTDTYHVLQNQLQQLRDYIDNSWLMLIDPRDGERKAYIDQSELLAMLDEFGVSEEQ